MRLKLLFAWLFLLCLPLSSSQESSSKEPKELWLDLGTIADHTYTNECLGLGFPIPDGWEINNIGRVRSEKALHLPNGGLGLLVIDQHTQGKSGNRVSLVAYPASDPTLTTKDVVANSVKSQVDADPQRRQLIHGALAVEFAGKQFFRSDYKQTLNFSQTIYVAFVLTRFRGYFIGESVTSGSPEQTDQAVQSLEKIKFEQDQPNPNCVVGPNEMPPGVIGGIISSHPSVPAGGVPQRVRISQMVPNALIVKKVEPVYPEDARYNRIQGSVVLRAEIDSEGNVQDLALLSGHPSLVPAAIEAVKQWKYKPYLLNGTPVNVETQVTIIFTLQLH